MKFRDEIQGVGEERNGWYEAALCRKHARSRLIAFFTALIV
jgi:hypothetical protein